MVIRAPDPWRSNCQEGDGDVSFVSHILWVWLGSRCMLLLLLSHDITPYMKQLSKLLNYLVIHNVILSAYDLTLVFTSPTVNFLNSLVHTKGLC